MEYILVQTALTTDISYEISDLSGKKVVIGKLEHQKIPIENLANGSYILKLSSENKTQTLKLMISK